MNCKFVIAAAVLLAGGAQAQQMYRCGNTFSQQPCGAGAQVIATQGVQQPAVLPPDLPAAPGVTQAAEAACRQALTRDVAFRDPESVRIDGVRRGPLFRHRDMGPVRAYKMAVNAKNAYGGYTGDHEFVCFTKVDDEISVVLVQRLEDVRLAGH